MKTKHVLEKIISGFVSTIFGYFLYSLNLQKWLSIWLNRDYEYWLVFKSVIASIIIFSIFVFFGLHRVIFKKIKNRLLPFRLSLINHLFHILSKLLYILFLLFPIIAGIGYYYYHSNLWYEINKFPPKSLGILVADFREVDLSEYIPQGKYANLIKESLNPNIISCAEDLDISFKGTPAFFTSLDEARKYGKMMNADIVIWGEVFKSEGTISIRPKINTIYGFRWGISPERSFGLDIIGDYTEIWPLSSEPPNIDTMLLILDHFIVIPILSEFKANNLPPDIIKNYVSCCLKGDLHLPPKVTVQLKSIMAVFYMLDEKYDSCIQTSKEALSLVDESDLLPVDIETIKASIYPNMATSFFKIGSKDSSVFYLKETINTIPDLIRRPSIHLLLVCCQEFDYLKSELNSLWGYSPDTLVGDLILDINATCGEPFDTSFFYDYRAIYPGRFESRGARVLICEDSAR